MNPTGVALRAGLRRGWIELRQSFTNRQELFSQLFWPVVMLVVLYFLRDSNVRGSGFTLGTFVLPSILGMNLVIIGLVTTAQLLTVEREDGTLLRAKATPNGMLAYLVGKMVSVAGGQIASMLIVLISGSFIISNLALSSAGSWLTLAWVVVLGMLASLPVGAVLGTVFTSPRTLGAITLLLMGVVAMSGIFYPIVSLPGWLQVIAQLLTIYWIGLGMRSALLPDGAVHVEIGDSWRHLETIGVLGTWAVLGLVLAPIVLRRMARRESGSSVAARRQKAMQRVG